MLRNFFPRTRPPRIITASATETAIPEIEQSYPDAHQSHRRRRRSSAVNLVGSAPEGGGIRPVALRSTLRPRSGRRVVQVYILLQAYVYGESTNGLDDVYRRPDEHRAIKCVCVFAQILRRYGFQRR